VHIYEIEAIVRHLELRSDEVCRDKPFNAREVSDLVELEFVISEIVLQEADLVSGRIEGRLESIGYQVSIEKLIRLKFEHAVFNSFVGSA
jgi:hypothetical protein